MREIKLLGMLLVFASMSHNVWADQYTSLITVNVTVNVSPCEINGNKPIDIDFGNEVAVTDVPAGLAEKDIIYDLDCSSMDTAKSLKMEIQGAGADFDTSVLKTSITDLGIKIKANGADYPLNTTLNFATAEAKPLLKAVLVQNPGVRLQTGAFTAGATMKVDYQ